MLCYYSPLFYPDYILSCDKLKFKFTFLNFENLTRCASQLETYFEMNYYNSLKDYTFRHLFQFGMSGQSFVVGLDFNGATQDDRLKGYIEFNPNKILGDIYLQDGFVKGDSPFTAAEASSPPQGGEGCGERSEPHKADTEASIASASGSAVPGQTLSTRAQIKCLFSEIWSCLHYFTDSFTLARWDFAVDVFHNRSDVQLIKDRRKYSQFFKSLEDFTEYLGIGSNAGRVKVYNKRLEAGLDYDLTRIELTLDSLDASKMASVWPEIYVRRKIPLQTNKVLLQLLQKCDNSELGYYLKELNFRTRKKFIELLMDSKLEVQAEHFNLLCDMIVDNFVRQS